MGRIHYLVTQGTIEMRTQLIEPVLGPLAGSALRLSTIPHNEREPESRQQQHRRQNQESLREERRNESVVNPGCLRLAGIAKPASDRSSDPKAQECSPNEDSLQQPRINLNGHTDLKMLHRAGPVVMELSQFREANTGNGHGHGGNARSDREHSLQLGPSSLSKCRQLAGPLVTFAKEFADLRNHPIHLFIRQFRIHRQRQNSRGCRLRHREISCPPALIRVNLLSM